MQFTLWSVLLTAFGSQCIFLIAMLLFKPATNKAARNLLLGLFGIILLVILSNLWSATFLYREMPQVAGFARGMVLLPGPLLYLYALATLRTGFRFRTIHLLHFLPYMAAFVLIRIQEGGVPVSIKIAAIDSLMDGKVKMNFRNTCWFIAYFVHLFSYVVLIRRHMISSLSDTHAHYLIPLAQRIGWLKKINISLWITAMVFGFIVFYILYTGFYTIQGNYCYIVALASLVYLMAYQSVSDRAVIQPHFKMKYHTAGAKDAQKNDLLGTLIYLFEKEKIFEDPSLKISTLALRLKTQPHILSQVINEKMNRSFNDLVHHYRINAFKERVMAGDHSKFSIIGLAYDIGYNSKSAFNTAFKKQTGVTPSQYLKSRTA